MIRKRIARFAVIVVSCIGVAGILASPAAAETKWLNSYPLNPGENAFWSGVHASQSSGQSVGAAATCAGLRGQPGGQRCGGEGQRVWSVLSEIASEPYVHNHSTWKSWFNGWAS